MKRIQKLILLFCILAASPGLGFVIERDAAGYDNELKWPASAVGDIHYSIYNNTRPDGFDASVQAAATDWQNELRSEIGFTQDEDESPAPPIGDDGVNIVYYGSIIPDDYGHTYVWYDAPSGKIHGFDINLEPTPTVSPLYPWFYNPDPNYSPPSGYVDCLTFMRHWFGHALGVGDLKIDRAGDKNKVMYHPPRPGGRFKLSQDDKNAAEFQYPGPQYVNDRVWVRDGGYNSDPNCLDDGHEPYPIFYSWVSPDIGMVWTNPQHTAVRITVTCRNPTDTAQSCSCWLTLSPPGPSGIAFHGLNPPSMQETKRCQIPPGNIDRDRDGAIMDPNDYTNPAGDGQTTCEFDWELPEDILKWGQYCLVASVFQTPHMGPDAEPPLTTCCISSNDLCQSNYYDYWIGNYTGSVDSFISYNLTGMNVARYLTAQFQDSTDWTAGLDPVPVAGETVLAGDSGDVFRVTIRAGPVVQPGDSHLLLVRCVMVSLATGDTLDNGGIGIMARYRLAAGWAEITPLPAPPSGKMIEDGGCMAYDAGTDLIYASKGNNTGDFYAYSVPTGTWTNKTGVPLGAEGKQVYDGSVICSDGNGKLYLTKGNNTVGFWGYDAVTNAWRQLTNVLLGPSGDGVKGGAGLAWATKNGVGYVYLLKGFRNEFYRYDPTANTWTQLLDAPIGTANHIKWDAGSWLVSDPNPGAHMLYAFKGEYSEMYTYDTDADTWSHAKAAMPIPGTNGHKKAKDGGCGCVWFSPPADRPWRIYALKGGNTTKFWRYFPQGDSWQEQDDIPLKGMSGKPTKVDAGGALAGYPGVGVYAFKGNNTLEFWRFTPYEELGSQPGREGVMASSFDIGNVQFAIAPNPPSGGLATIRYSLPEAGTARLSVYNVAGQMVMAQSLLVGRSGSANLDIRHLSNGVYLVKLQSQGLTVKQRLVVQR